MHYRIEGDVLVAKLDDGQDLFEALESLVNENNIDSAVILSGIGMLRDFEFGYFNGQEYDKKRIDEPMELVSLMGTISTRPRFIAHLHCGVAGPDHMISGGHLFSATVNVTNEIALRILKEVEIQREPDPKTGLMAMKIVSK